MQLRSIQVLRGLAACAVVVLHARFFAEQPIGDSIARLGAAGVDLFFVISGFIMATIAKPPMSRFLFDRAWRIYPLWFIAVTPWILWKQPDLSGLASSLTLWPVYQHFTPPALALGWTLSFELLFYAAVALAMRTRPAVPLAIFAVALVAYPVTHAPLFKFIGNPMIFEFLFGVAVARLPRTERVGWPMLAAGAVGFAAAPLALYGADVAVDASVSAWRVAFWGIPAALIVYGCLCLEKRFAARLFAPFVLLGDASFSIYLFHRGVIEVVHMPWPLDLALAIGAGLLAWYVFELPLRAMKRTILHKGHASGPRDRIEQDEQFHLRDPEVVTLHQR